ncbi:U4/U6-U5 snRNP complex subunit lsm6 [Mycoemilia scoparia]|uniref:U4/U6-U5 snRNP complex subunit lsm6 n=1 Tax=Mycoemilia scoparia TaxID=417184 RepID=A0A9W7ZXS5_9FUNG|nr:U4/U6-U5 snRNP complex subunit lsm6 [Mycoemilia scoparia]
MSTPAATNPAASNSSRKTPTDFLNGIIGKSSITIDIKLGYAWHFVGVLTCLDGYMNIALEQTEEYVNGELKNKYGDAFVRGNNGKSQNAYAMIVTAYELVAAKESKGA